MTVEMMTKLLADAEAYFGRPQTAENRASIAEIWANSSLKDVPDEMAYKTFHEVISECSWQSQLLPAWKKRPLKRPGASRCWQSVALLPAPGCSSPEWKESFLGRQTRTEDEMPRYKVIVECNGPHGNAALTTASTPRVSLRQSSGPASWRATITPSIGTSNQ